jgi:hypothetical protein
MAERICRAHAHIRSGRSASHAWQASMAHLCTVFPLNCNEKYPEKQPSFAALTHSLSFVLGSVLLAIVISGALANRVLFPTFGTRASYVPVSDVAPHGPVHQRHPHQPHLLAVVEKSSTNIVYPTLTRSNYTEWSLVMKVNPRSHPSRRAAGDASGPGGQVHGA